MDPTENLKNMQNPKKLHNASNVVYLLKILATCGISLNTNLTTANKQQSPMPTAVQTENTHCEDCAVCKIFRILGGVGVCDVFVASGRETRARA